jgi:hypothetical protein
VNDVVERCFADALTGALWDRIREIRRSVIGGEGAQMSEDEVPSELRDLLPYASLLTTGEEATLAEFWWAMDAGTRESLVALIVPRFEAIRAFGVGLPISKTRDAFLDLVRLMDVEEWGRDPQ